jgi:flagellar motor switch protein FliN/FliY
MLDSNRQSTQNDTQANDRRWLIETLTNQLAEVIETMTGDRPLTEFHTAETPAEPGAASTVTFCQPLRLPAEAPMWIVAPREVWHEIGSRILQAAGVGDSDEDTVRGTFLEIASQTSSVLARSTSTRLGTEISSAPGYESELPSSVTDWFAISLNFDETRIGPLSISFPQELLAVLSAPAEEKTDLVIAESVQAPAAAPPAKSRSLDLLLDVELPVSVSFGRAQLPLKDVIKLTSGSIVELNRTVTEPVEVIVNNCVIARGEVVVVEGNFGVRILQVVSRQDRLRTLD